MINKGIRKFFALLVFTFLLGSCAVAPYQKMYLNDREMVLSQKKIVTFESNFESYREGASGANGGKVGGGCGCN